MHARCLRLGAERRIWRRESERVGSYNRFYLLNRRLYDVGKGFQLGKGVLRHHSEDTVRQLASTIHAVTCLSYTLRHYVRWMSLTEKTKGDLRQRRTLEDSERRLRAAAVVLYHDWHNIISLSNRYREKLLCNLVRGRNTNPGTVSIRKAHLHSRLV
jgi:hypothetical protein